MQPILDMLDPRALVQRVVEFLPDLATALVLLLAAGVLYRVTRPALEAALRRAGFHDTLIEMLVRNLYRFVILVFGMVMAADQLGVNVGAALAGIGVAGIAVGLAAQDSLANTVAGFLIFWDKPFEVDDWVTVAGEYGRVSHITMRTTRIRTNQNTYVVIPNRKIIDEILVNHSKHGATRIDVPVGIAYKEDIGAAREALLAAVSGLADVAAKPAPDVVAVELGDSSVNLRVRVWIDDAAREQPVSFAVVEAAKKALDAAGIQIPFPHLQLFVDQVDRRVFDGLAAVPAFAARGGGAAAR